MDKLTMAHQMALAIQGTKLLHDMGLVSDMAWKYADAMQAEADKRECKERPEALCEVDWRVAPQDTTGWKMKEDKAYWIDSDGWIIEEAPTFGFTGTHVAERPHGF